MNHENYCFELHPIGDHCCKFEFGPKWLQAGQPSFEQGDAIDCP